MHDASSEFFNAIKDVKFVCESKRFEDLDKCDQIYLTKKYINTNPYKYGLLTQEDVYNPIFEIFNEVLSNPCAITLPIKINSLKLKDRLLKAAMPSVEEIYDSMELKNKSLLKSKH